MCGIVAYTGKQSAREVLIDGLKRLEYRGYDSSGIAILNSPAYWARTVGKVAALEQRVWQDAPEGVVGIAHTRWATHGKPSENNAHPHVDCTGKIYLAHNGIIENYLLLKKRLAAAGHTFSSETDTEVLPHLIESLYQGNLEAAVQKALLQVQGTFGLAVLHAAHPEQIIVARRGSPIVLGVGENESFAASDASALARHTDQVVYLEDNEVARLEPGRFSITTLENRAVNREATTLEVGPEAMERGSYPHFMLKEIFEQPEAVENALRGRVNHCGGSSQARRVGVCAGPASTGSPSHHCQLRHQLLRRPVCPLCFRDSYGFDGGDGVGLGIPLSQTESAAEHRRAGHQPVRRNRRHARRSARGQAQGGLGAWTGECGGQHHRP